MVRIYAGRVRKMQIEAYEKQQEEANRGKSAIYFTDVDDEEGGDGNIDESSSSNMNSNPASDIENRGKPGQPSHNNNNNNNNNNTSSNNSSNNNSNGNGSSKDTSSSDKSKQLKPSFNHLLGLNGGGRYMPSSSMRDRGRRG